MRERWRDGSFTGDPDMLGNGSLFPLGPSFRGHMVPISAEFTDMVTGHGLTRLYIRRFKIIPNSTCPCGLKSRTDN